MQRIGILGAGSWGTALSVLLTGNGHAVTLWEFRPDVAEHLAAVRENPAMLPGIPIPPSVCITADLNKAVLNQELVVVAVPSHSVREVAARLAAFDHSTVPVLSVVKGLEGATLLRMSEVLLETLPDLPADHLCVLSGPSHAEEVSRQVPTAVVAVSESPRLAREVQQTFMNPVFRVYVHEDLSGVELCGALKNVIAIAAGLCDGAGLGDNTKAALLTRGIAEMCRLGVAMGADPRTFHGLAGIGDLIVTCLSRYSRNRYVGEQVGRGRPLAEVLAGMVMVAEGVGTTPAARALARRYEIETPIMRKVHEVLYEHADPRTAVTELMTRAAKHEYEDSARRY